MMIPCDSCLGTGQVICERHRWVIGAGQLSELGAYLGYHNEACPECKGSGKVIDQTGVPTHLRQAVSVRLLRHGGKENG
jgi:DnaJ-class molecular chaperone